MVLVMLFSITIGVAMYSAYAIFCNWIFRLLLSPLQVPAVFAVVARRDRLMTFLAFVSLPLTWIGVIVLLVTYIRGIFRHIRDQRAVAAGAPPLVLPRIPRIPLSELMVMVFSLALFPVLIGGIVEVIFSALPDSQHARATPDWQGVKTFWIVTAFVVGALIFPLCFASAYQRLDGNKIPLSHSRLAFLFLYPYLTFAMQALLGGALVIVLLAGIRSSEFSIDRVMTTLLVLWICAGVLLCVGRYLAACVASSRPAQ